MGHQACGRVNQGWSPTFSGTVLSCQVCVWAKGEERKHGSQTEVPQETEVLQEQPQSSDSLSCGACEVRQPCLLTLSPHSVAMFVDLSSPICPMRTVISTLQSAHMKSV